MKMKTHKCPQKFTNLKKLHKFEMFSAVESQILNAETRTIVGRVFVIIKAFFTRLLRARFCILNFCDIMRTMNGLKS